MARLRLLAEQIREIEAARLERLTRQPNQGAHPMVRLLAQVHGLGIETADRLAHEAFSRRLRDSRAVARYGGLTGAPDESGARRRDKGLARAGNARVRRGMIQLAWRFMMFKKDSALAQWYRERTADARGAYPQSLDCRAGAQAAHRLVAADHHRRSAARRRASSGVVSRRSTSGYHRTSGAPRSAGPLPIMIRGGGDSRQAWLPRRP
jgi:transposase